MQRMTELEPLYDKTVTCQYCDKTFVTKHVRIGASRLLKQDSDWCPYYEGENPIFYDVFVCPHCGFAFTDSFSKLTPNSRVKIEKEYMEKLDSIPDITGKRSLPEAIRSYKMATVSSFFLNKAAITGNLFLRLAWLYRYKEDREEERDYLEKALLFYKDAYEKGSARYRVMSDHQLLYLIGDLSIRLGKTSEATKVFSLLFADSSVPPKIKKRATERWQEFKSSEKD